MASPDRPRAGACRSADVALRHLAPRGRARVHWPAPCADPTVAALVVLFAPDDDLVGELGADAARLAVVSDRAGAALAERVAELAVDEGWPPLRHVALIWPHDDPTAALDGLADALTRSTR